jgi:hypothetical protein
VYREEGLGFYISFGPARQGKSKGKALLLGAGLPHWLLSFPPPFSWFVFSLTACWRPLPSSHHHHQHPPGRVAGKDHTRAFGSGVYVAHTRTSTSLFRIVLN